MVGVAIEVGFFLTTQRPLQETYLNNTVPWIDTAEALANIPAGARHAYMMINIDGLLYWFLPDLTTLQLVSETLLQTAAETEIEDVMGYYTSGNVEGALQEIGATLEGLKNPFTLYLPASSDVAGRIAGATVPVGWSIDATDDVNLLITHTVEDRILSHVTVFEVDGTQRRMCVPFSEAFTGVIEDGFDVTIEGLNPTALALVVNLFFT